MRGRRLCLAALGLGLLAAPAAAQPSAAEACGYQIDFPAPPAERSEFVSAGTQKTQRWHVTLQHDGLSYSVMCQTVAGVLPPEGRRQILEVAPRGFTGELVSDRWIEVDGQPGRAFAHQVTPTAGAVFTRAYVTDRAVVIVSTGKLQAQATDEPAASRRFHASFHPVASRR